MIPPDLTYVFTAYVNVASPQDIGDATTGRRRVIPILGGTVSGPRLTATVLPGGADWQVIRPDGTAELIARYTLRTDDGTIIAVTNSGIRRGPPAALARLAAGELVDPSEYYFRANPVFDVGAGPHRWLADSLFIATGERRPNQVFIRFFAVS